MIMFFVVNRMIAKILFIKMGGFAYEAKFAFEAKPEKLGS